MMTHLAPFGNFRRLSSLCLLVFALLSFASTAHASPISITSCAQLELIGAGNPAYAATSSYILNGPSNVIDCSAINSGNGFFRIQDFTGTLDGNGNTITGLYENYPSNADVGLFEDIESGGLVENLTIASSTIVGLNTVGVLAGVSNSGTIQNVTVMGGTVTGTSTAQDIGGLIGHNTGTIATSSAAVSVQGTTAVGGLVGENSGTINGSWATGAVSSTDSNAENIGGFSGVDDSGASSINSYATGNVTASSTNNSNIGGFVGAESSTVTNTYAIGNVTVPAGSQTIGGYAGFISGVVTNSFSTGIVTAPQPGSNEIGGYVGNNNFASLVNDAWYLHSGGDGTYAEGDDQGFGLPNIPLLATLGYGTDEATSSNFYNVTEPVYALGNGGWDFTTVWIPHLNSYPTLGVSSSTFITSASTGTGGSLTPNPVATGTPPVVISSGGGGGGSGGSIPNQVSNLLGENNYSKAISLIKQYKNLFSTSTKLTVTHVSVSSTTTTTVSTSTVDTFIHNLSYGSRRIEVKALQEYLNAHGFLIATSGSGSPGNETTYFGKALRTSLIKFQKANGIHPATGNFGPATRKYINEHL